MKPVIPVPSQRAAHRLGDPAGPQQGPGPGVPGASTPGWAWIFGLRLNFFVASELCLGALLWFLALQRGWRGMGMGMGMGMGVHRVGGAPAEPSPPLTRGVPAASAGGPQCGR